MLDWSKLKPYKLDCKKSFEELCYQIAREEFESQGIFTSIDDSGGGDGVEFYITLPNGDEWGWQAKFFGGNGRLKESGREQQITDSLTTAIKKHPNLKKWFLCLKTNFTPDKKGKKEKTIKGELTWFSENLTNQIPENMNLELIHWGAREFNNFMPKYQDIYKYFFTDKILTFDWFNKRFNEIIDLTQIKAKYESKLHIRGDADKEVVKILGGVNLSKLLNSEMEHQQVQIYSKDYENSIHELINTKVDDEFEILRKEFTEFIEPNKDIINIGIKKLVELGKLLSENKIKVIKQKLFEFEKYLKDVDNYFEAYKELIQSQKCKKLKFQKLFKFEKNDDSKIRRIRSLLFSPFYALGEYAISSIKNVFRVFELSEQQELHISGDAGMGKTHLAINIYERQLKQKLPSIFIFGKNFNSTDSLVEQLKQQLDVPTDWNLDDFLGALNIAGKVYDSKVPIILDGLNESISWKEIFTDNLEALCIKIKSYPNLVLITTYRSSYEKQLFPKDFFKKDVWKKKSWVSGFEDYNVYDAIRQYTKFYKINLKNYSHAINEFKKPLFLKIFCEAKKGEDVSFQNEDLFDVFEEYLVKCNENIVKNLGKDIQYSKLFTLNKLKEIIKYLWKNNLREIPLDEIINKSFQEDELRAFEGESLLILRNWNKEEKISFTYDLFGGYLIAKEIMLELDTKEKAINFINSKNFSEKLLDKDKQHPIYDDILRCLCVILIKKYKLFLFTELKDDTVKKYSLESLFEINISYIQENEKVIKKFLKELFLIPEKRNMIFNLSKHTEFNEEHPLNFDFFSDLLKSLSMVERDLFWSEYIRKDYDWIGESYFSNFVQDFEKACREKEELSNSIHLASKKIMWILTTNIRKLRDLATQALYYYSRRFPNEFFDLLTYSLNINDPYIPERMMAVAYGYAMFIHNNKSQPTHEEIKQLSKYGKFIYKNIFDIKSEHNTNHILMRDYAKGFLDISLKYNPNLLSKTEKKLLIYPLRKYPHIKWGQSKDKDGGKYREGNAPIHMDFGNYTIGRLIKDRGNYQDEHPEYKKVLSNIYWRIYQLGYSLDKFGEIDKQIANNRNYSRINESNKIDRYGKKYSWIAYYEMAGCRSDLGLIREWNNEETFRISDVDIDPSFPMPLKNLNFEKYLPKNSLLRKDISTEDWLNLEPFDNVNNILKINGLFDLKNDYEWILIRGTILQKNKQNQTEEIYMSINGVIIDNNEIEKIDAMIQNKEYVFHNIDNPGDYYLYEGEFIWSDLMNYNEKMREKFDIIENEQIKESKEIIFTHATFINKWEDYHSELDGAGSTIIPSKQISEYFKLKLKPQSSDLYCEKNKLASTTFTYNESGKNELTLTYLRKDLLQKYLKEKNKKFVWLKCANKSFFEKGINNLNKGKNDNKFRYFYNIEKFMR